MDTDTYSHTDYNDVEIIADDEYLYNDVRIKDDEEEDTQKVEKNIHDYKKLNSESFNRELIKTIQKHPCLYKKCFSRKYLENRNKAWLAVSKKMKLSVVSCKTRWFQLRMKLHRLWRRYCCNCKQRTQWPYIDDMSFLLPYLRVYHPQTINVLSLCRCEDYSEKSVPADKVKPFTKQWETIEIDDDSNDECQAEKSHTMSLDETMQCNGNNEEELKAAIKFCTDIGQPDAETNVETCGSENVSNNKKFKSTIELCRDDSNKNEMCDDNDDVSTAIKIEDSDSEPQKEIEMDANKDNCIEAFGQDNTETIKIISIKCAKEAQELMEMSSKLNDKDEKCEVYNFGCFRNDANSTYNTNEDSECKELENESIKCEKAKKRALKNKIDNDIERVKIASINKTKVRYEETAKNAIPRRFHSDESERVFDERLLDTIKNYPTIYERDGRSFSTRIERANAWKEIGRKLNESDKMCQDRWTYLQKNLNAIVSTSKRPVLDKVEPSCKKKIILRNYWIEKYKWFMTHMSFLENSYVLRKKVSMLNVLLSNCDDASNDSVRNIDSDSSEDVQSANKDNNEMDEEGWSDPETEESLLKTCITDALKKSNSQRFSNSDDEELEHYSNFFT